MAIKDRGSSLSFTEITAEFPSNLTIGLTPDSLSEFDNMIVSKLNRTTGRYTQYVIPANPSFSDFYNVDWGFEIDVLVVGGGGAGGSLLSTGNFAQACGGGGGGYANRIDNLYIVPGRNYSLTVGGAGMPGNQTGGSRGGNGRNSIFTYIRRDGTTINYVGRGGGGGGGGLNNLVNGANGGCGGGGAGASSFGVGGIGSPGRNGGRSVSAAARSRKGGGGGGTTEVGQNGEVYAATSGGGGAGLNLVGFMGTAASQIPTGVGGGGGAGIALTGNTTTRPPGANGGGDGTNATGSLDSGRDGARRTGGGGGGGSKYGNNQEGAGDGGSGVIIVRYRGNYRRDTSSGDNVQYTTGVINDVTYQFVIFGRRALNYGSLKANDFNEIFSVPSTPVYA